MQVWQIDYFTQKYCDLSLKFQYREYISFTFITFTYLFIQFIKGRVDSSIIQKLGAWRQLFDKKSGKQIILCKNAVNPSFLVMIVQLDFMVNINYLDFTRPYDRYKGVSFDILPPTDPNHLVSFDYQQGFSAIFVSIPCFLPRDKVHDFFKSCGHFIFKKC